MYGRRLQGVVLGVWQAGGGKTCLAEGVNPTGSITVTKPNERCPWLVCPCKAVPLWFRGATSKETQGLFLHAPACFFSETFQTKVFFQKRIRGAAWMLFPLSAMLLEDFGISYLGSFLPAPTLSWRPPTVMGSVTRRHSLREGE